jgi:predicted transposase YbfD/YdcC
MQYTATASQGVTVTFQIEHLPQAFASIPDPRRAQGTRYSLASILSLAVVALLANHTSVLAMAEWVAAQPHQVRQALGFVRATTPHQTTIQRILQRLDPADLAAAVRRSVEKGHGRLEERQIRVSSELAGYHPWPYLAQVFEYTRTWTAKGRTKQQVRYGITSLPVSVSDAAHLAKLKRGHWQVENGLHYVKDVTLGEDASQTHVRNGADVFAMVRNIAISLIRRAGYRRIAAQLRHFSRHPYEALKLLGIHLKENA